MYSGKETAVNRPLVIQGLPWWLSGENPPANEGDAGSILESGRSPGGGNGTPSPVFLPGTSHGEKSLVGYSPWGHKSEILLNNNQQQMWQVVQCGEVGSILESDDQVSSQSSGESLPLDCEFHQWLSVPSPLTFERRIKQLEESGGACFPSPTRAVRGICSILSSGKTVSPEGRLCQEKHNALAYFKTVPCSFQKQKTIFL